MRERTGRWGWQRAVGIPRREGLCGADGGGKRSRGSLDRGQAVPARFVQPDEEPARPWVIRCVRLRPEWVAVADIPRGRNHLVVL